jgi:nitrogen fixation/metabolism regulation signal transduction histidine kinase
MGINADPRESTEINQVILNIIVNAAQAIESQKKDGKGPSRYGHSPPMECRDQNTDTPRSPETVRTKIFDLSSDKGTRAGARA